MIPILFNPLEHKYTSPRGVYISVTQLIKKVTPVFNTEYHSEAVVDKRGMDAQYWKDKWKAKSDNALSDGHAFHEMQEMLSHAAGIEKRGQKIVRVQNQERIEEFTDDYLYWPDGVYNELLLWNDDVMLAGKADKVIFTTCTDLIRVADVEDFKTNEQIRRRSWYDEEKGYRMLLHPLSHIMDCDYWKYALQFSMYQWMLESMGFTPGKRILRHHPPLPAGLADYPGERDPHPIIDELPYLREEVITLTNWYAKEIKRSAQM
jgi:hypothetical protein